MDNKKYELTDETIVVNDFIYDLTLYRIRALWDFGNVKKGDFGGYIATEENLSHTGLAWVYDNACVYGNAKVYGNARVYDNAKVYDNACVYDNAYVGNNAQVYDNASIYDGAVVYGYAKVYDNARIYNGALVGGTAWIGGNTRVYNNVIVRGDVCFCNDAIIKYDEDYMTFGSFGSAGRTTTIYRTETGCEIKCGCFSGTLNEFRDKVKDTHGNNRYAKEYLAIADIAEIRFGKNNC